MTEQNQTNEQDHISKQLADIRDAQLPGNRIHEDGTPVTDKEIRTTAQDADDRGENDRKVDTKKNKLDKS